MDPSQMMPRSFPMWAPPAPSDAAPPPPPQAQPFLPPPNANRGWKRKNPNPGGYQPPAIADLQVQNRAKARRWFKNNNPSNNNNRKYFFPNHKPKAAAPRNTTSFIIRAKRAGGIASLVSPCPVTPAVLPTPRISPSREGLSDMAQQQWGVDGYGSMKGLIRLRSSPQPPNAAAAVSDDDEEENSSGSDVEEHVEVERRLDHDLSRFEMVYPGRGGEAGGYVFEEDDEYDQDVHVARLEEENLTLKERLFLMEQEVGDMRRRLEALEARFSGTADAVGGRGENALEGALDNATDRDNAAAGAENAADALDNVTDRDNLIAGVENAAEEAMKNDSQRENAPIGAENAAGEALENDSQRENAPIGAENAAGEALENDSQRENALIGAENAAGEALENDSQRENALIGAENAAVEALENGRDNAQEALENGTEGANAAAVAENDIGMDDVEPEKIGEDNAKGDDTGLQKSGENTADGAGAGSEKNSENNAVMGDAGSGKKKGGEEAGLRIRQ